VAELLAILAVARDETVIANVTDAELEQARMVYRALSAGYEQRVQPWLAGLDVKPTVRAYAEDEGREPFAPDWIRRNVASCMLLTLGVFRRLSSAEGAAALDRLTARVEDDDSQTVTAARSRRQRAA
jgi:hypothetical protein